MKTDALCENDRVRLREVGLEDAPLLVEWKNDPIVKKMALGRAPDATGEGQEKDVRRAMESRDDLYLILEARDEDGPVGYVRVNWMDGEHRFAWLRFALGRRRGEGLMRSGLTCLLGHLFADGAARVDAEAYAFNERSLRLMEGLGFVHEGRKRRAHIDEGGEFHDIVALGLLPEDFRPSP